MCKIYLYIFSIWYKLCVHIIYYVYMYIMYTIRIYYIVFQVLNKSKTFERVAHIDWLIDFREGRRYNVNSRSSPHRFLYYRQCINYIIRVDTYTYKSTACVVCMSTKSFSPVSIDDYLHNIDNYDIGIGIWKNIKKTIAIK